MTTQTWQIDSAHSGIHFSVRHLVIAKVRGQFSRWTGALTVPDGDFSQASVDVTIDATSIETGVADRDGHLVSADFFDVATFPELTFVSTSVERDGDSWEITGDLTIKDITKEVVLKANLLGFAPGMRPGTFLTGWEATTTIKKSDFGLAGPAMLQKALGDDVALTINIEAGYKKG